MVVQLPAEALGPAIWVFLYSVVCLICSSLTIWLVSKHHERYSFVALLGYMTFLSTLASLAQQLHTMSRWTDIKIAQFDYVSKNFGCPEIAIAGPSVGIDLVFFYIQYYSYSVESMLTLFWAIALTHSVFRITGLSKFKRIKRKVNIITKALAILLPLLFICLLQLNSVQHSFITFLFLANVILVVSLSLGILLLLAILSRYIYTRRRLLVWDVQYPCERSLNSQEAEEEADRETIRTLERNEIRKTIYDRWLIIRFTIAFVLLGAFQAYNILAEIYQVKNHSPKAVGKRPDLSPGLARIDFFNFMPGVSASLLVFVVFGTTRTFRNTMYITFVPKWFQRKEKRKSNPRSSVISVRPPAQISVRDVEAGRFVDRSSVIGFKEPDSEPKPSANSVPSPPEPRASTETVNIRDVL
ncbi:hypothetical protein F5Y15DRAFT_381222 [Xylariaceae sp. FL0016]|nr:hypothetical protein F5Y15DRAFT_381222 [Xylariaceae sp. FL0016]